MMYHYLYKTTNLVNGKYYIGRHSTKNPNDGYLGSGVFLKKAVEKYGVDNFMIEIVEYFDTYEQLIEAEKSAVEKILKDPMSYNTGVGGLGGSSKEHWTDAKKKKHSEIMVEVNNTEEKKIKTSETVLFLHKERGKSYWTEEGIESKRKAMKNNSHKLGKKESDETKAKKRIAFAKSEKFQANIRRKKTQEQKDKISNANKGKNRGSLNSMSSFENRIKVSLSKIGRKKMISPEGKAYMVRKEEQEKKIKEGYRYPSNNAV